MASKGYTRSYSYYFWMTIWKETPSFCENLCQNGENTVMFVLTGLSSAACCAAEGACCLCSTISCCGRCCRGSKKDSDEEELESNNEGAGRSGSMLTMIMAVLLALAGQFWAYTYVEDQEAWDCDNKPTCTQFAFTERVAFTTTMFFFVMAMVCGVMPSFHDKAWDIKIICYILILFTLMFAPNHIFDDHGYVWFARVGAFIFLVLQQIILVDFAYTMNEILFVYNRNVLLIAAVFLFLVSLVGLILLFVYFTGCSNNDAFISISLVGTLLFTAIQLLSDPSHGHNLLTSSAVAAYVTYLTYIAVSSNPTGDGKCNPTYSSSKDPLAIVLGLGIAFISMAATVYFAASSVTQLIHSDEEAGRNNQITRDLLTGGDGNIDEGEAASRPSGSVRGSMRRNLKEEGNIVWKFNIVMILICQYWCMVLTNWGNDKSSSSDASPTAGFTAMWMNITASWICMCLYMWTLLAPALFPNRDFS